MSWTPLLLPLQTSWGGDIPRMCAKGMLPAGARHARGSPRLTAQPCSRQAG
jgi:hypothetical protein